jgi:hypothetical protein
MTGQCEMVTLPNLSRKKIQWEYKIIEESDSFPILFMGPA